MEHFSDNRDYHNIRYMQSLLYKYPNFVKQVKSDIKNIIKGSPRYNEKYRLLLGGSTNIEYLLLFVLTELNDIKHNSLIEKYRTVIEKLSPSCSPSQECIEKKRLQSKIFTLLSKKNKNQSDVFFELCKKDVWGKEKIGKILMFEDALLKMNITFSVLKLMMNNPPYLLYEKLKTIINYNEKNRENKIIGSALGLCIKYGTAEELEKKLTIIEDYNEKNSENKIVGYSLGLYIEHGTADELKEKLKTIINYNEKILFSLNANKSYNSLLSSDGYYNSVFCVLIFRYCRSILFGSSKKNYTLHKKFIDKIINVLNIIQFPDQELLQNNQQLYENIFEQIKEEFDGSVKLEQIKEILYLIMSLYTGCAYIGTRQLLSLKRIFSYQEKGMNYSISDKQVDYILRNLTDYSVTAEMTDIIDKNQYKINFIRYIEKKYNYYNQKNLEGLCDILMQLYGVDDLINIFDHAYNYQTKNIDDFIQYIISIIEQ